MARRGGWRRRGRKGSFRYVDAHGKPIIDPEKIERIEELAIPPAWRDVWISPRPRAKLQATGIDRAGRRQYLYHPEFRARQEQEKFDRLVLFAERLPALRKVMSKHLAGEPFEPEWTCALAVRLINLGWFRVGTDRYARTTKTFGITTLRKSHVSVRASKITFRYRSKHRSWVRSAVVDAELAQAMKELLALPGGSRLFRYRYDDSFCNLTGARLNEYIGEHLGEEFTAKDFRTLGRDAPGRDRLRGARAARERDRRATSCSRRDACGRRATRKYSRGCPLILCESRRRRAVSRR